MACKITVTCKEIKGHCGVGMKVGDIATFDETNISGKVCMGALSSMMGKIFAMQQGVNFPWLEDPDVSTHACPDAENPVIFEVRRDKSDG